MIFGKRKGQGKERKDSSSPPFRRPSLPSSQSPSLTPPSFSSLLPSPLPEEMGCGVDEVNYIQILLSHVPPKNFGVFVNFVNYERPNLGTLDVLPGAEESWYNNRRREGGRREGRKKEGGKKLKGLPHF
jgi:hypothetical protein